MELLATDKLKVKFSNQAPGGLVYLGNLGVDGTKITTTKSSKSKAEGSPLCVVAVNAVFSDVKPCPHTFTAHTFTAGGGVVAAASAVKVKDGGSPVLRKGDTGSCVGSWVNNSSGAAVNCQCNTEIIDPGQGTNHGN
jgi:hypothetical protein